MPTLPKHPSERRRPNRGPTFHSLPAEGRKGKPPPLPPKKPTWLKATREWWARIWRSPSASMWAEADYDVAVRLALIRDEIFRGPANAALHSVASQLEDRLGLSPKARAALGWHTGREAAPAEGEPVPQQERTDPRKVKLRAV